jgi:hypothetical protein
VSAAEDFPAHPRVYRPVQFTCHSGGCDIGFAERPEREIAGALLEETGDWFAAVKALDYTNVPPGVSEALRALHDAACGWVEWLDKSASRSNSGTPPLPQDRMEP